MSPCLQDKPAILSEFHLPLSPESGVQWYRSSEGGLGLLLLYVNPMMRTEIGVGVEVNMCCVERADWSRLEAGGCGTTLTVHHIQHCNLETVHNAGAVSLI